MPKSHPAINIPKNDLGRIHLIGCGAIGSSFAFLYPFCRQTGNLLLVDPDHIEAHNTSSSLLFTFQDSVGNLEKVRVCEKYLAEFGIPATHLNKEYSEFPYDHSSTDLKAADIMLCFANENNIWSTIQNLYPPLCLHATTSKSWGIHIGRHIPLIENCIMCTFKDILETAFLPVCAGITLPVKTSERERVDSRLHTAIFPFLAPAAAIVTLAELLKTVSVTSVRDNTTSFNMSTKDGIFTGD